MQSVLHILYMAQKLAVRCANFYFARKSITVTHKIVYQLFNMKVTCVLRSGIL